MILCWVFLSLLDRALDIILYKHSTKDMGLNSSRFCGFLVLGTKVMKDVLLPLGHLTSLILVI